MKHRNTYPVFGSGTRFSAGRGKQHFSLAPALPYTSGPKRAQSSMKRFFIILLLIIVAVIAAPFLFQRDRPMPPVQGLPWQIETRADGTATVFGLTLDRSTLGEARTRFGQELEIAIIAAPGEPGALEGYVAHFTAGVLTGKLVLSANLSDETLQQMRQRAARVNPTATGALKLRLAEEDLARALQARISGITFIPSVDIDQATAVKRFGEPAERVSDRNDATHFLYPDKGLDLMLNPEQKDVLQYVAPAHFDRLLRPFAEQSQETP